MGLPNKSSPSSNICLEEKGKISFDSKSNAEFFKNVFENISQNLVSKLPNPKNIFDIDSVCSYYTKINKSQISLTFRLTTSEEICKILKDMDTSKAAGIDNISGIFLKDGAAILATPISQLCNLSITSSSFPKDCKIAKLKPLYKKGRKTDPKNYRPISLLPLISKVLERVIHNQTQQYLIKNNILYNFQSGLSNKPFY